MPAWIPMALLGNLRRMRAQKLRRETSLTKDQAKTVLQGVFSRSSPTTAGRMTKLGALTRQEASVLLCVGTQIKGGRLFNADDLFEDFCRALQRQKLLHPAEKQKFKKSKVAIALFGLIAMHSRKIDLGDNSIAKLTICANPQKKLAIYAYKDVGTGFSRSLNVAVVIFETDLSVADYCEPGVAPIGRFPFIGDFEMTPELKLRRVL
jgi:hypothetical protein